MVCCSVPGNSVSACSRLASCEEIAAKFVLEDLISEVSCAVDPAERLRDLLEVVDRVADVLVRCASSVVNVCVSRFSGAKRLNVPRRSATALGLGAAPVGGAVVEQLRPAGEQEQQVVAGVGVERGQDLRRR